MRHASAASAPGIKRCPFAYIAALLLQIADQLVVVAHQGLGLRVLLFRFAAMLAQSVQATRGFINKRPGEVKAAPASRRSQSAPKTRQEPVLVGTPKAAPPAAKATKSTIGNSVTGGQNGRFYANWR